MKRIPSKLAATAALMLAVALSASASLYSGGDHSEKLLRLKADLNLTNEQVAQLEEKFVQLEPIIARARTIRTELENLADSPDPDEKAIQAKHAELEKAKKEYKEKVAEIFRSVLTREQFAKWESMQAEHNKSRATQRMQS